jgi:putative permease
VTNLRAQSPAFGIIKRRTVRANNVKATADLRRCEQVAPFEFLGSVRHGLWWDSRRCRRRRPRQLVPGVIVAHNIMRLASGSVEHSWLLAPDFCFLFPIFRFLLSSYMVQMENGPNHENNSIRPLSYGDLLRLFLIVVLVVLGIAVALAIKETLLLFAIAFLLAMVLNPAVVLLERHGLKRGVAVGLLITVLLAILALVVFLVIPPFFEQLQQLIEQIPGEWNRLYEQIQGWIKTYPTLQQALPSRAGDMLNTVTAQVGGIANFLLRSTLNLANGVLVALLCFLVVIFTLIEPEPITIAYLELVPPRYREPAGRSLARMMQQVSAWAHGVVINGIATGASTGILLALVGVQPAFLFGVLAFLGEFVPIIGPVIVAIPALFVAASMGLGKFVLALLSVLFVQQVETNLLVPFIMGRQMKLHAVTIIFFTFAMSSLFGFLGLILVVPTAALVKIVISEFYLRPRGIRSESVVHQARDLVTGQIKIN